MSTGQALIAVAGPSMNLMLGTILALLHVILLAQRVVVAHTPISDALMMASEVNFFLLFFNLLPIPPLDGGWVLQWVTPYKYRRYIDHYNVYAPFVFMAVVFIPQLRFLFQWPADQVSHFMYHSFGSIFGYPIP
jgi:Zn-dependent protease